MEPVGGETFPTVALAVSLREAAELAQLWGCPFMETSAKTGVNVCEVYAQVVREIRKTRGVAVEERPAKSTPRLIAMCAIL